MSFDVAVVGSGPAGSVAAYVLAKAGRNVCLIDRPPKLARKIGESLPGVANTLLRSLNLSLLLNSEDHLPAQGNCSAWGSNELVSADFIRDPHGHGWHLQRKTFDADLRKAAVAAGVFWLPEHLVNLRKQNGYWEIETEESEGKSLWVVDATGRQASVARKLGQIPVKDDSLMAAYTWVKTGRGEDTRTLVEATAKGWWYTSALPDETRVLAFHSDPAQISCVLKSTWKVELQQTVHVKQFIEGARPLTEIVGAQASGARLHKFGGDGWLATGDAALAFDPLSSQGIFNALYTGMKAAQCIHAELDGNKNAVNGYYLRLEEIRAAYLEHHRYTYGFERRWREASFWQKRASSI